MIDIRFGGGQGSLHVMAGPHAPFRLERRAFQLAVLIAGIVPVVVGAAGMTFGIDFMDAWDSAENAVAVDSHARYLSGLLLGIAVAFWATVRHPERHAGRFRLLTAIVVVGGLGRLLGLALHGAPSPPMLFGLAMELAVTPALCLWRERIARG